MKFHCVFNDPLLRSLALSLGLKEAGNSDDAGLFLFPGGPDVDPKFYGEYRHPTTQEDTVKNLREMFYFRRYPNQYKIGICGGGQILNVLNGGRMFQDSDHPNLHRISFQTDVAVIETHIVNSTHHQIMRAGKGAEILGWCNVATYRESMTPKDYPNDDALEFDNEIIWYGETKSLCFQPHPEYGHAETRRVFEECLKYIGIL